MLIGDHNVMKMAIMIGGIDMLMCINGYNDWKYWYVNVYKYCEALLILGD